MVELIMTQSKWEWPYNPRDRVPIKQKISKNPLDSLFFLAVSPCNPGVACTPHTQAQLRSRRAPHLFGDVQKTSNFTKI